MTKRLERVKARHLKPYDHSLKYLAWLYSTAKRGTDEERIAGEVLVERVIGNTLQDPARRYHEITEEP